MKGMKNESTQIRDSNSEEIKRYDEREILID